VNTTITTSQIKAMKTKDPVGYFALALIVSSLALPLATHADQQQKNEHSRYKLIDLGTFGGPSSGIISFNEQMINNQGTAIGVADTPVPDPFDPNCFAASCFVQHAFQWKHGVLTDLGALPGGSSSAATWINERGQIVGVSQNGLIDPLTGAPASSAVLWQNGEIVDLGTLGGNQSVALGLNNGGQVIGVAANAIADPFSFFGFGTQTRAFLWDNGVMRDLGTLGGPDSIPWGINERGQVAGVSYTDSTPNNTTGIPTIHAFLWQDDRMLDLGSLGGTLADVFKINGRGQVAGNMSLPGDEFQHPFVWDRGTLTDLGTLGGNNGYAKWMNDAGVVVGEADFPGDVLHNAFLWKDGVMTDLGNLGVTSSAHYINSRGQVVGASRVSFETGEIRAFLWENGGPMIDLNTRVPADSGLELVYALSINDRGEIFGLGMPGGGPSADVFTRGHAFVLIPVGRQE
jgi:probable HAF family extracellular repeat protein